MAEQRESVAQQHASSAGHAMATADWLDAHFEACRPEYEAGLQFVGIQPGWQVLDAGCGGGSYLPWLAKLVGETGRLSALDLDEANVATVLERMGAWNLPCAVEVRVGDVFALPYPDASFDAVWCANLSQYFTDAQVGRLIDEFRRVVRPGGLVAIKEFDTYQVRMLPAPLTSFWHFAENWKAHNLARRSGWSSTGLGACLRHVGLEAIRQRTFLIERFAPLAAADRRYIGEVLTMFAQTALSCEEGGTVLIPDEEHALYHDLAQGDHQGSLLDHPDFYFCEGSVVAVGRVP